MVGSSWKTFRLIQKLHHALEEAASINQWITTERKKWDKQGYSSGYHEPNISTTVNIQISFETVYWASALLNGAQSLPLLKIFPSASHTVLQGNLTECLNHPTGR